MIITGFLLEIMTANVIVLSIVQLFFYHTFTGWWDGVNVSANSSSKDQAIMNRRWLTLNMGLGCLGWDGAVAVVAAAGAGDGDVTWSAGSDSGTVWRVGRIVVDISTPVRTLYTSLAHPHCSHPLRRPPSQPARSTQAFTSTVTLPSNQLNRSPNNNAHLTAFSTVKIHSEDLLGQPGHYTYSYFTFTQMLTIVEMENGNRHAKNY